MLVCVTGLSEHPRLFVSLERGPRLPTLAWHGATLQLAPRSQLE